MNFDKDQQFTLRDLIFFASIVLTNLRATVFFPFSPETTIIPLGTAWVEIGLWLTILLFALIDLLKNKQAVAYLDLWWGNKILILFVLFSGVSIFWSVDIDFSLFRWLELLCITLLAVYFGTHYTLLHILKLLSIAGVLLVLTTFGLGLFLPEIGISSGFPYYGAWNGIFWHKNHLGALMSFFNVTFLFLIFYYYPLNKLKSIFLTFFYIATIVLIILSESATALVVTGILTLLFCLSQVIRKIRYHIKRRHYYLGIGIFLTTIIFAYFNLDFLLGLLGKDKTLTGRTELWEYLIEKVIVKNPWFGYGFGAFWNIQEYRVKITQRIGWGSQVLISDNGFLDILIHLGIIGFAIFIIILLQAFTRSITMLHESENNLLLFSLFFLAYAMVLNITFSLFTETEVFIWMMIVWILISNQRVNEFKTSAKSIFAEVDGNKKK